MSTTKRNTKGLTGFEFFIARRISTKQSGEGKNVMVRIATITVAISMMVMLVAFAVISGFKAEITDKVIGFGAHLQVRHLDGNRSFETIPIRRNPTLERKATDIKNIDRVEYYAVKGAILRSDEGMEGVMLKGIGGEYDWSFFKSNLVEGRLPVVGDSVRTKDIILSKRVAQKLKIAVEDRVEMLFMQENKPPRRDRFKVVGIYDSGFEELDKVMVLTDIRNVQRLNRWEQDQITGYEITTTKFKDLERFKSDFYDVLVESQQESMDDVMLTEIKDQYPNLFDWLKAHDVNVMVIVVIMLLVALLNMIAAMLIVVFERTKMIGILKALGMTNGALQRVFLIRSGYIVIRGMLWGNVLGIGLSLLQKGTGLVKLDQAGYFLSEVPIRLEWEWIAALNVGVFVVVLLILMIPTMVVSKIKPERTIRFQ